MSKICLFCVYLTFPYLISFKIPPYISEAIRESVTYSTAEDMQILFFKDENEILIQHVCMHYSRYILNCASNEDVLIAI